MAFSYFYWLSGIWHSMINVTTPRTAQTPKFRLHLADLSLLYVLNDIPPLVGYNVSSMAIWSSGDMLLAQHLLNSSIIYVNAANLSVRYRFCRVLASSKDIMAFMKTRRLKLILTENIGWPTSTLISCLNFRKFCPSKPLAYEIPKKARSSSFVTSLRDLYLSLLRTSSGSCSINAIIFLLVLLFKTVVITSSVKKFVHMSMGYFLLRTLSCVLWS